MGVRNYVSTVAVEPGSHSPTHKIILGWIELNIFILRAFIIYIL